MTTPPTRRRLLGALAGAGVTALAGCTGDEGTPTDTTTASPAGAGNADAATTTGTASTATPERPTTVRFKSTAGTAVQGTLYGRGDCGVVLVPQINLDRGSWEPQATALAERGHVALAIDEDPDNRWQSALGAARFLRETTGVSTLVLVGASSGGEAVVRANANAETDVAGLVTLSAAGGADVAGQLQGRKLFVVSENDEDRFVRIARELHENAPDPARLKVYGGSAHGQRIFESHGADLRRRLFGLVERACEE